MIPSNKSRSKPIPHAKHLCKERHLVECCFAKLKHFRRAATRYEKTACNFQATVTLACAMIRSR